MAASHITGPVTIYNGSTFTWFMYDEVSPPLVYIPWLDEDLEMDMGL